jgi:hypothetical protein
MNWYLRTVAMVLLLTVIAPAQSSPAKPDPPLAPSASVAMGPYYPINGKQRLRWFVGSTIGPETLTAGVLSAAFGTARDRPQEYGSSWPGFGKRYGLRLTGVSTSNAMEAALGAIWGEDPRYFRSYGQAFKGRVLHVIIFSFTAHNREGQLRPAYARYMAAAGNNFLSNTWRPDSEATTQNALSRTAFQFAGLVGKNAFLELWPDLKRHMPRKISSVTPR